MKIEIPDKLIPFMTSKKPMKITHGGRGSAKSWTIARLLVAKAVSEKDHLILCCREFQNSIADSVYALIEAQVRAMNWTPFFKFTDTEIYCTITNSKFIFKGLRRNVAEIKGMEGVTLTWVEEAQAVTAFSWQILLPTVFRRGGSELWVSFNPMDEQDYSFRRFISQPDPDMLVIEMNWRDNPWFPKELNAQRLRDQRHDPDTYEWIWEGATRSISDAVIFRNRFSVEPFDEPDKHNRLFFGVDFGYSTDPCAALRSYLSEDERYLFITHEAYDWKVELDQMPAFLKGGRSTKSGDNREWQGLPDIDQWPVKGDSSRPESISYVRRHAELNFTAADKWAGSVEDGIEHLKSYERIIIHPRCHYMGREARMYSYKVDERTQDVLPVIVDAHNHAWDAQRYALDGIIQRSGATGSWGKLARGL